MEKFIILAGSPNSGKTISVNIAINKLLNNGFKVKNYFVDKTVQNFWTYLDNQNVPSEKSGSIVLENNGKKIVFISYGDKTSSLTTVFEQINFDDYYAVVCCSHATRGKKVFDFFHTKIGQIDLNKTQVIPIYKNLLSKHNNDLQENEHTANLLIDLLQ